MKILLLGEASNLHWTLGEGLRALGHDVVVVSGGSGFMNNRRDISLVRGDGLRGAIRYVFDVARQLPSFRGYDIVQIHNPEFLHLRPCKNRVIYNYLRRHNRKIFLDALGTDYYYVKACQEGLYRYSDFFVGNQLRDYPHCGQIVEAWNDRPLKNQCQYVAETCNGIIACLYEYYIAYEKEYKEKLAYIPIPIQLDRYTVRPMNDTREKVRFFLGIQLHRSRLKGTDVYKEVLQELHTRYPKECEIKEVVSVPLDEYLRLMRSSDVILDQLYSYTPATNALQAMAQGLAAVSGGEPEFYDFIGEKTLRPIINARPDAESVYRTLEEVILKREELPQRCADSRTFVEKHHNYTDVAQQYLDFWEKH